MYALLVLVLAMGAALVVDVGLLQMDRRLERTASDTASTAGAAALTDNPGSRAQACRVAFEYALANLGESKTGATYPPCDNLVMSPCDPAASSPVTGYKGRYTVEIASPVPDTSDFMDSDVSPGSAPNQPVDPAKDGDPCSRIGVRVFADRPFAFAAVAGFGSGTTGAQAVAYSEVIGTTPGTEVPVSVAALDQRACHAIRITGTGGLRIGVNTDAVPYPGFIAVDSDGTGGQGFNDCSSGIHTVIEIDRSFLHASPTASGEPGTIGEYALSGPNPASAYVPATVVGCDPTDPTPSARLCPVPSPLGGPVTDQPWRDSWDIGAVDAALGGVGAGTPGWTPIPDPTLPLLQQQRACGQVTGQPDVFYPTGDYVVTCPGTWTIDANVGFGAGSRVVLTQDLHLIGSVGCLITGSVSLFDTRIRCTGASLPSSGAPSTLFTGDHDITRERNANILLARTLVRSDGRLDIKPGGNGDLGWTAPVTGPMAGVAYWGEQAPTPTEDAADFAFTHRIGGQGSKTHVTGVFFAPHGLLIVDIELSRTTWRAQLVADRVRMAGDDDLTLIPDKGLSIPVPLVGVHLIR
jgi:hypothetical protein